MPFVSLISGWVRVRKLCLQHLRSTEWLKKLVKCIQVGFLSAFLQKLLQRNSSSHLFKMLTNKHRTSRAQTLSS